MAIQFQGTSPATHLAFERKIGKKQPSQVHFEGLQKADTVSFGMTAPSPEAAKNIFLKVKDFVMNNGKKVIDLVKKVFSMLIGIPKKIMGLFAKKAPEAAEQVVKAAT